MTCQINDYLLVGFVKGLNDGLLFRDSNCFTQFSKNTDSVFQFYKRFFEEESVDFVKDMSQLFNSLVNHVYHPQMLMVILRVLGLQFSNKN